MVVSRAFLFHMSLAIPVPYECVKCPAECVPAQVPGPPGTDGTDGSNGAAGANAYTALTDSFVMPAVGNTVVIEVGDTAWIVPEQGGVGGQALAIEFAGTLIVDSIVSATQVQVRNDGYAENAPAGTVIPALSRVGVSGREGATGAAPAGLLVAANNLSDLLNPATARTNLGLGSAATLAATAFLQPVNNLSDVANAATSRTNLGLAIGTDVQAFSAFLAGLAAAGPGVADRIAYLTAANTWALATLTAAMRALLASASNAALLAALNTYPRMGLIGSLIGADMDITTDQAISISSSRYKVFGVLATNASINLTTAAGGVYNAVGKPGGGVLVGAGQVYTALTAAAKFVDLTLAGVALTDVQTAATIYLSLSVAQGAAATADFYVFGQDLS